MKETVVDPTWRRRLLVFDAVLILVLGWLLWGAFGDGDFGDGDPGDGDPSDAEPSKIESGVQTDALGGDSDPIAPPPR